MLYIVFHWRRSVTVAQLAPTQLDRVQFLAPLPIRKETMGDVLEFAPKPKKEECPLYLVDNIDIAFCLFAVNMYGVQHTAELQLIGPKDLSTLRVDFVRDCLIRATETDVLTEDGKAYIERILTTKPRQ